MKIKVRYYNNSKFFKSNKNKSLLSQKYYHSRKMSLKRKTYEQISFNTESQQIQDKYKQREPDSIEQESQGDQVLSFKDKIKNLQKQLYDQKQKSSQLQKRNQQLMDMLVSASQSNVKRNEVFIAEIQRKIYNYRAVNQFGSGKISNQQLNLNNHSNVSFQSSKINSAYSSNGSFNAYPQKINSQYKEFSPITIERKQSRSTLKQDKQNHNILNRQKSSKNIKYQINLKENRESPNIYKSKQCFQSLNFQKSNFIKDFQKKSKQNPVSNRLKGFNVSNLENNLKKNETQIFNKSNYSKISSNIQNRNIRF